jgi:hypothetical protein
MDKGLNGINKIAEQVIVGDFLTGLSKFVRELPVKILVQICWPFWRESGSDVADEKKARKQLYKKAQSGFYPISIMGLFAAIYFGLLFLL